MVVSGLDLSRWPMRSIICLYCSRSSRCEKNTNMLPLPGRLHERTDFFPAFQSRRFCGTWSRRWPRRNVLSRSTRSCFQWQATTSADVENLNISAKATGEFEIRADISGGGYYNPFRFYNGDARADKLHKVMKITFGEHVGIMSTGRYSRVLFRVDKKTSIPLSGSIQKQSVIVRPTYTDRAREMWIGYLGKSVGLFRIAMRLIITIRLH